MSADPDGDLPFATGSESAESSGLGDAMARARPEQTAGLKLAQAKVAGAMFGSEATSGVGRFRILERLGAGGMGVVHAAYDPDLDRGVALKLVPVPARGRDGALAEAKALARLSHPNVVPIYDVGLAGDHVYIVMELVRGKTLGRWVEGRPRREVLEAYQQAGAALAAAHQAGLVHRDFKPDNAIVGADGRVRVVDFGLACEAEDPAQVGERTARIAGTPKYMPPEQANGGAVTAAADQYSFCVALELALATCSEQPLPRWVAAVIQRGRAADPGARFESMGRLLRALARDPARTWKRRGAATALALTIGGIAFAVGHQKAAAPEPEACTGAGPELEQTWSTAARTAALARLETLGAYGGSVRALIAPALEDHAKRWVEESHAICRAHRSGGASDALFDLQVACLWESRSALGAVARITDAATAATLAELPRAVRELPDPARCRSASVISDLARPAPAIHAQVALVHNRIAEARIQLAAGRHGEARATAAGAVTDARRLEYEPLLAEALLVEGHATMLVTRRAAVPILTEAIDLAMSARADALAVEAWARRAFAQGTSTDPNAALAGLDVIEPIARRTEAARFARALLYNNVGTIHLARDRRDLARRAFELASVEASSVTGPGEVELLGARTNLALAIDDRRDADAMIQHVIGELTQRLGADHPDTLTPRWMRGIVTIDSMPAAGSVLEAVCRGYDLHPALGAEAALCWTEVGLIRMELGDRAAAREAVERASRAPVAAADRPPELAAYVALLRGDAKAATRLLIAEIEARPPGSGDPWWHTLKRAELRIGLSRARRETGDLDGARQALETSIAELEPLVRDHPTTLYERRLGRARVELVQALAALHAPRSQLVDLAGPALTWLRRAEGDPREIATLAALSTD